MTPEPTDELVERVREALAMHPGWQQADVALTELAERLKAAELRCEEEAQYSTRLQMERDEWQGRAEVTRDHARGDLLERLKAAEERLTMYETPGWINSVQKVLEERARAEAAERERDECAVLLADTTLSTHDLAAQRDELVEILEWVTTTPHEELWRRQEDVDRVRAALAKHRDPYGPIGHETC